jgi:hypothetical protein
MRKTAKSELEQIPGVGKSIARDLQNIGINSIADLKGKNPETLYAQSNRFAGMTLEKCPLYVFRGAVYFAGHENPEPSKLKWWYWKDPKQD